MQWHLHTRHPSKNSMFRGCLCAAHKKNESSRRKSQPEAGKSRVFKLFVHLGGIYCSCWIVSWTEQTHLHIGSSISHVPSPSPNKYANSRTHAHEHTHTHTHTHISPTNRCWRKHAWCSSPRESRRKQEQDTKRKLQNGKKRLKVNLNQLTRRKLRRQWLLVVSKEKCWLMKSDDFE